MNGFPTSGPAPEPRRQLRLDSVLEPERKGVIRWLEIQSERGGSVTISSEMAAWIARELKEGA